MFKKLFGVVVAAGAAAAATKVVKDVLKADEEEKQVIEINNCEEAKVETEE